MQRKTTDLAKSGDFSGPKKLEKSAQVSSSSVSKPASSASAKSISTPLAANLAVIRPLPESCPFQLLVDEWLEACRAEGLSPKTITGYAEKLAKFRWWWVEYSKHLSHPENVTTKDIRSFAAYLREPLGFRWGMEVPPRHQELSAASIAAYGRTVKVFFNWLEREEYIEKSPFNRSVKFSTKKQQDRIIKRVADEDLSRIFATLFKEADKGSYHGVRNLAMISLLIDSGVRRGELLSIRLCDIDFKAGRCAIRGKTGQRYALFSEECKKALLRYYKKWRSQQDDAPTSAFWLTEDGEALAYNSFGTVIRRLVKNSEVDFHAHQLRHTFASLMAQRGTNVFDLKEMLGHTNISTTQIYVQSNVEHLAQVHREKSPLNTLASDISKRVKRRRGRPRKQR
jgi:site-specific recombinase XerD